MVKGASLVSDDADGCTGLECVRPISLITSTDSDLHDDATSTFASSAPSGYLPQLKEYFGIGEEVGTLIIALFVGGYCVGPLVWAPLSETYGRRPIFIISFIGYVGFQVGAALSRNTASILIFRFLGGTFASSPLTNSG